MFGTPESNIDRLRNREPFDGGFVQAYVELSVYWLFARDKFFEKWLVLRQSAKDSSLLLRLSISA